MENQGNQGPSSPQAPQETLDINDRLLETVGARRALGDVKGALAQSILAQNLVKDTKGPINSSPAQVCQPSATTAIEAIDLEELDPNDLLRKHGGAEIGQNDEESLRATEDPNDPTTWRDYTASDEERDAADDAAKFDDTEFWYNGLFNPTMEDTVKYEAARQKEDIRRKTVAKRKVLEKALEEQKQSEDELFCSPCEAAGPSQNARLEDDCEKADKGKKPIRGARAKRQSKPSAQDRKRSIKLGLDFVLGHFGEKSWGKSHKRTAGDHPSDSILHARKRLKKKRKELSADLREILTTDVIKEAHESAGLPQIPVTSERNKAKALARLVASIPHQDQEEAKSDRKLIERASRSFTPSAKTDEQGGWKIKGLKTSLYHYQLQGAAFMRDRERSLVPPYGGMLCDTMGFGKTIQALANIVDGKPTDPEDPVKTTLIVVPSHLVPHWKRQILMHCEQGAIGPFVECHAKVKVGSLSPSDTADVLQKFGVILTTYDEVRRSYPPMRIPKDALSEKQVNEWWNAFYQNEVGPLHLIKFLRIILDEGHMIKNHLSSVSIAVRALTGKHKWILSGTPIMNHTDEFYPHFDFLEVPNTTSYEKFEKDYCRDGDEGQDRLVNLLRAVLFRRTHASRLFSLPVISLPDIEERIVEVQICEAEYILYDAIQQIFIDAINGLFSTENPRVAQYRCFLTMILKMRMFSSHTLTAQDIVKAILTDDVMCDLSQASRNDKTPEQPSVKITTWLRAMSKGIMMPSSPTHAIDPTQSVDELKGDSKKLTGDFYNFMDQLHEEENWVERLERTNCPSCTLPPDNPVITDCKHMYCEECYYMLPQRDIASDTGHKVCSKCSRDIQEAAKCGPRDGLDLEEPPSEKASSRKTKKKTKRKAIPTMTEAITGRVGDTTGDGDTEDDETDWITACAGKMPSAKLSKIQEIVAVWLDQNPTVKVVIFTQFISFVRILADMCYHQKWKFTCLTGKMRIAAREESLQRFKDDTSFNILIASLKAGGTGLDMSMASKCILVDLWWNEAVQQQAFSRLLRIGQRNDVEVVKLIATETIDDYMHQLQSQKSIAIAETIGEDILSQRESIKTLLEMFATVTESESGAFFIQPKRKTRSGQ